ncbi:RBR-type E3 ubiquitin transferase [Aphelenchoides bicaudatus]|nr:RBR-type E3 ubiquitin transferase [Aphelenchoides bicaudatus]
MSSDSDVVLCSEDESDYDESYEQDFGLEFVKPKEETEITLYEVLDAKGSLKELDVLINDIHSLTCLPLGVCSVVLAKFQWKKQPLFERYEGLGSNLDALLRDCKVVQFDQNTTGQIDNCNVCFEENVPLIGLSCSHKFCGECWEMHLKSKIEDERNWMINCMEDECGGLLCEDTIRRMTTDNDLFQQYRELTAESFIQVSDLVKWCPGSDCKRAIRINDPECLGVKCSCLKSFCIGCDLEENHDPISCKRFEQWKNKSHEDNASLVWINQNSKKCPLCKAPIEKSGGCNHMTCRITSCRHEFCWLCLEPWRHHRACNQFTENRADPMSADLQAYVHYNDRYTAHRNSLKFEENLNQVVEEKIRHLQDLYQFTYGQIKFLRTAVSTLAECRRTLMYTYPFAFFIRSNNQKIIFEDNQQKLEFLTEELRQLIPHLLENQLDFEIKEIESWKSRIIDQFKLVGEQRTNLLNHVFEGNRNHEWDYKE